MTVLAAYKPSSAGEAVLAAAMGEARLRETDLLVARHVRPDRLTPQEPAARAGDSAIRDLAGQDIRKLEEELEALKWRPGAQGIQCDTVLLAKDSDASAAILDLAQHSHVDLIVIGVRRRSRLGKALLGSDSQQILLRADCAVLAVKADEAD